MTYPPLHPSRHQVADKEDDGAPLDHTWSKLVERCFYKTQKHFEAFAAARPKLLFLDYVRALDKAESPAAFARAMEEAVWWAKANVPQVPAPHAPRSVRHSEWSLANLVYLGRPPPFPGPDELARGLRHVCG